MATPAHRRSENQEGSLFVDRSCINCGTCRIIAPRIFAEVAGQSAVVCQPKERSEWVEASRAIISCPTHSIGSQEKRITELKEAIMSFPSLIEDGVYYCGYAARASYGASSYLIVRPNGNVLIDSPQFHPQLVKQIEKLGGIQYLFLTHKDDVADHALFQKHFGCERMIHADDVSSDTEMVERKLSGLKPTRIAEDLIAIPTPGHTKGHMVLLYRDKFLFTGDHLAYSDKKKALYAFENACWFSWERQIESVRLLKDFKFEWVLPAHGGRGCFHGASTQLIENCADAMMSILK